MSLRNSVPKGKLPMKIVKATLLNEETRRKEYIPPASQMSIWLRIPIEAKVKPDIPVGIKTSLGGDQNKIP